MQVKALQQMEQSRKAHQECLQESAAIHQELQVSLQKKLASAQSAVDSVHSSVTSTNNTIDGLKESHRQLLAAVKATQAPITLCLWRMGQRERRPLREHVRDPVAVALEQERNILFGIEKKINESSKTTLSLIASLEAHRDKLQADLVQKRQAMKVDELCLRTSGTHAQAISPPQGPPRPSGSRPSSGRPGSRPRSAGVCSAGSRPRSAGAAGFRGRQPSARGSALSYGNDKVRQILKEQGFMKGNAATREQEARDLREENLRMVKRLEIVQADAKAKTERALQERVTEIHEMRKRLETEAQETKKKQRNTKAIISETRSQMEQLEEPMALCSMHSSWRKHRAKNEPADYVESRLEEQKWHLLNTTKELKNNRQIEKGILTELEEHMERLKEDLQDKTAALAIDLNCLSQGKSNAIPILMSGRMPFAI